ncbi:MAG: glycosyltransferase [Formivibrio sp.]|nr:glycosyltransferase [Formivibrio sp.]
MKFSLILATLGRTDEVNKFIQSLMCQSYNDVELIVVDQNTDDRLIPILAPCYELFSVKHLKTSPGLSYARNVGLKHVSGDIVAFPDDDCWYAKDVLEKVKDKFLKCRNIDVLTGRSIDGDGDESGSNFARESGYVDRFDVWTKAISYTIFLRAIVCKAVGGFDETLGVGAKTRFGSGEETDYLIRALDKKCQIYYLHDLTVFHPNKILEFNEATFKRARLYAAGKGRVLSKHGYPLFYKMKILGRPCIGSIISLLQGNIPQAKYRLNNALGRAEGLMAKVDAAEI